MIKYILPTLLLIAVFIDCFSQTRTISGKVVSNYNKPVPGVSVLVKGKMIGTVTDETGEFSIQVPDHEKIILVFSFGSILEKELSKDQTYIKVKLELGESYHSVYAMIGINFNATESNIGMNYAVGYRYLYYRFGLGAELNYIQSNQSNKKESDFDHLGVPIIAFWRFAAYRLTTYLGTGYYWGINKGSNNNDFKSMVGLSYERNRFAFDFRYLNGFTRISDEVNDTRKNFCVGVRYRFH